MRPFSRPGRGAAPKPGIPFVLSSAYDTAQLRCHEVLANVENVRKPFQQSHLLAAVGRALGTG